MSHTIDDADREFLGELKRLKSASVSQLCAALGVTATAVRQRLNRLQAAGLVERQTVHTDRGRPRHEYSLTSEGRSGLGDNYGELALVLWRELSKIEDPSVKEALIGSLKTSMVERYGSNVDGVTSEQRLKQLRNVLDDRGFKVEIDQQRELPILRENNCPYLELATNDPSICELEKTVFEEILGTSVKLTQCCLDGHHCCEFEVANTEEETVKNNNQLNVLHS